MIEDEQELISNLKKGNERAYQLLFELHYAFLISYAAKFLPSIDLSREVVQKVFVRLFEKRHSLHIRSLKAYLTKSVYYACMEELRFEKKFVEQRDDDRIDLEDKLVQAEEEAAIWKAIDDLPEKCRQIFVMNRFDCFNNQQIADILNLSKRTVETQISLALKKLRKNLLTLVAILGF